MEDAGSQLQGQNSIINVLISDDELERNE